MSDSDKYIKTLNLSLTRTIDHLDIVRTDFDFDSKEVDFSNSISLENLVKSFNDSYFKFKEEYASLNKDILGEGVSLFDYNVDDEVLSFYIENPNFSDKKNVILYILNFYGKLYSKILYAPTYEPMIICKKEDVPFNKSFGELFELFKEYSDTYLKYKFLKNGSFYSNSTWLSTSFCDDKYSFLNDLSLLKIALGDDSFADEFCLQLFIKLGNNCGIDYDKSKFISNIRLFNHDKELIKKMYSNVYINNDDVYQRVRNK